MPTENAAIRRLLENLIGGGFVASILVDSFQFTEQKIVGFDNGTVIHVDRNGTAHQTIIAQIRSVNF